MHGAGIQDRDGAAEAPRSIRHRWAWLRHVFADGGYAGAKLRGRLAQIGDGTIEIINRPDAAAGIRDRGGRTWRVEVEAESAFRFEGRRWRSLSAIAREITGTSRNGPAFFGLRGGGDGAA